jgi:hypothetical protein
MRDNNINVLTTRERINMSKSPQDFINETGYPLQLRLEKWINETSNEHHWEILTKERRWTNNQTGEDGYIDMVLRSGNGILFLVIECKRIIGSWNFIVTKQKSSKQSNISHLYHDYREKAKYWRYTPLCPESYEVPYCVMETDGKRDGRTLEKWAGELLMSLESFSQRYYSLIPEQTLGQYPPFAAYYLPVIVTTADLNVVIVDPTDKGIDITKGVVLDSEIESVDYLRFCKNLATGFKDNPERTIIDFNKLDRENDRTILIVKAEHFIDFLIELEYNC